MTIHISDHAVLRYLERTGRVDVVGIRADLAKRIDLCAAAAVRIGISGTYAVRIDGVKLLIVGSTATAVTALPGRKSRERDRG